MRTKETIQQEIKEESDSWKETAKNQKGWIVGSLTMTILKMELEQLEKLEQDATPNKTI
jgi:hypothetical protein